MKKLLSILLAAVMLFSMFSVTSVATLAADGGHTCCNRGNGGKRVF